MSPDQRIGSLAARQHGVVTWAQALAAGLTPHAIAHRVRTGRWMRLSKGVYAICGAPSTWERRIFAALAPFGELAAATSRTAGWLYGWTQDPGDVVFAVLPSGQHRRPRKGVVLTEADLQRSDVRVVRGIRSTSPNRTLVELARVLAGRALEAALDEAILVGHTTVPSLVRFIDERELRHRPGMGALSRLLDDRHLGVPQRELERMFLRKLRAAGLPEPVRQHPCGSRRIDFAYPDGRIAIELDGRAPHFTGRAFREDPRRQNEIVLAGFIVLRFTWEDISERWAETERVLRAALRRASVL